jgi:choline dehydrogenase-like flavoprotein
MEMTLMASDAQFDYVIVGSGAGGGPLAANLAEAGFKVLLMEAGGDEDSLDYSVPGFNGLSTEDQAYGAAGDAMAVLDGDFRVRNTRNLRVVDASVFPHIPGTFIVLPVYMVSEKAASVIIRDTAAS